MSAALLTALQPFGTIPPSDYLPLLAAWQSRPVGEGEFLTQAGASCQELFFIEQGVLRVVARSPLGKELTHSFRHAGQLCTLLASFTAQVPTLLRLQAACPTHVLAISYTGLQVLEQQFPYLPSLLARYQQQTLLDKLHLQRAYTGQDAATRYQTFLVQQPAIARQVPQHQIASYLGITPQSLSRLRKTSY